MLVKMNNAEYEETKETIETEFIDRYDLATIIEMIVDICHEKAEHLRYSWQDENTAEVWKHTAECLDELLSRIVNPG